MYQIPPSRKMMMLCIVDILRRYADKDHGLRQQDIVNILEKDYQVKVDRKTVERYLDDLIVFGEEIGYRVNYDVTKRTTSMVNKETGKTEDVETDIRHGFYLDKDFYDEELRLLIDNLLYSQYIPYYHRKDLIDKIRNLSGKHFQEKVRHVANLPKNQSTNQDFFYTIDVLDEAIGKNRQVSFSYLEYDIDKKLHKRCDAFGNVRIYIINPYQMVMKEGKYYLICNYDKYEDISNYRIDRIADIQILDTPIKPFKKLKGANSQNLDLTKYMNEHMYMYSGENVHAKFRVVNAMISDVIDIFGADVKFSNKTERYVDVSVYVNENAMFQFAKNYSPDVVVLSPEKLVERVKEDLVKSLDGYNKNY